MPATSTLRPRTGDDPPSAPAHSELWLRGRRREALRMAPLHGMHPGRARQRRIGPADPDHPEDPARSPRDRGLLHHHTLIGIMRPGRAKVITITRIMPRSMRSWMSVRERKPDTPDLTLIAQRPSTSLTCDVSHRWYERTLSEECYP